MNQCRFESSSVFPYTSRQGSATLKIFPPQWWANSVSMTDLSLHLLKIFMGPDVLEHFYDPKPTEVTNHCHHMETNPTSSVTQGVSRFAQLWCSEVSVCLNEEGFKYLSMWHLDHQCLRCPTISIYFQAAALTHSDNVNLSTTLGYFNLQDRNTLLDSWSGRTPSVYFAQHIQSLHLWNV